MTNEKQRLVKVSFKVAETEAKTFLLQFNNLVSKTKVELVQYKERGWTKISRKEQAKNILESTTFSAEEKLRKVTEILKLGVD